MSQENHGSEQDQRDNASLGESTDAEREVSFDQGADSAFGESGPSGTDADEMGEAEVDSASTEPEQPADPQD